MGKAQVKKKFAKSEEVGAKNQQFKKNKLNAFEVHINKEKFKILGRTLPADKGLPGVSRSKAIKKRKQTLGNEFQRRFKDNKFRDKRLGRHSEMTDEEIAQARFTEERISQYKSKKGSIYNLDDNEMLTHKGQTLAELEKYDDVVVSDSDDDGGRLDADFTKIAHFGGGGDSDSENEDDDHNKRKTAIEDLIADQKRRKVENLKEKEEVNMLTDQLDDQWKNLQLLMAKMTDDGTQEKPKPDTYDKTVKELIFERRGEPTDKLKSEKEILEKEKKRLEELEKQRIARMNGDFEKKKTVAPSHRSADALDEDYYVGEEPDNSDEDEDNNEETNINNNSEFEDSDDNVSINYGEDENEINNADDDNEQESEEEVEEDDDDDESEEDADNKLSDFDDSETEEAQPEITKKAKKSKNEDANVSKEDRLKLIKQAENELPYTFDLPNVYEEFEELLGKYKVAQQCVIINRMIKTNHPKIDPANRPGMTKLFGYLIRYICQEFTDINESNCQDIFYKFNILGKNLLELAKLDPQGTTNLMRHVVNDRRRAYENNVKTFPGLECLMMFKLTSHLYTPSDYRHPIVTPCILFMSEILSNCCITNRSDFAKALFIVTVLLEFTCDSKRYIPASINVLEYILSAAINVDDKKDQSSIALNDLGYKKIEYKKLNSVDFITEEIDASFKLAITNLSLKLFQQFLELQKESVNSYYMTLRLKKILKNVNYKTYPKWLNETLDECRSALTESQNQKLRHLTLPAKKPKMLRLLEPKFGRVFDDKRNQKVMGKEKAIRETLKQKIKRETKGAIRELRRDNQFIAKEKLTKQLELDAERKDKVRRIFGEAAQQQGELNELKRNKKR